MTPPPLGLILLAAALPLAGSAQSAGPIARRLQPFVDRHELAGAVTLVASRERVIDLEAVGYADVAEHRPMTTDALFFIASMSKPIAATCVMMLVDEGRLRVDDPVAKYVPELKDLLVVAEKDPSHELLRPPAHPITIRQLMTHTSGLPDKTRLEIKRDRLTLDEDMQLYSMLHLSFEPGSRYSYSSAEVNVMGCIVQRVSGLPYPEFLRRRLFQPLGMVDTTFWPTPQQLRRLATAYMPAGPDGLHSVPIEYWTYPLDNRARRACPSGGLFSTARDLAKFCQMIARGGVAGDRRLLSERSVREMTSTQTGDLYVNMPSRFNRPGVSGYGYCWLTVRKGPDGRVPSDWGMFSHGGSYGTNMRIDPRRDRIYIFLLQSSGGYTAAIHQFHDAFSDEVAKDFWPSGT